MSGRVVHLATKPETPGERGLPKRPVGEARVLAAGMVGDFNRHRAEKQGGDLDAALVLLMRESLDAVRAAGWPVEPGHIGENVLVEDVELVAGGRYRLGDDVVVEISRVCDPCHNLELLPYVGRARLKEFMQALLGRRGWYARVVREGRVRVGDAVSPL